VFLCRGKSDFSRYIYLFIYIYIYKKKNESICDEGGDDNIMGKETTGGWRKIQNEVIHNLYPSLQTIILKYMETC
jgi:hypothetical protein